MNHKDDHSKLIASLTTENPAVRRVSQSTLKHWTNGNGLDFCSGRAGWSSRKTTELREVTCKNCLKGLSILAATFGRSL